MERNKLARMAAPGPSRPKYRAARAFYLFMLIGLCFAIYLSLNVAQDDAGVRGVGILKRGDVGPLDDGEQCRLVHQAHDQCAFVKRECPTEEGGFAAYLDLYFCTLAHVKAVAFMILISWLGLLFSTIGIAASDFFCINLSTIARILGMSESMAGVTFLAFGNGSPDVFSTFAAMKTNSGSLAVGELFGAAGFITAVVAGSMALIRPFYVAKKSFVRDVGFFIVAAGFSLVFLWDGKLFFWECVAMVAFYIFYVAFVVVWHWWLGRRRREREREATMRGHFVGHDDDLRVEEEDYHDDPEESGAVGLDPEGISREDWSALERGHDNFNDSANEEEEEAERDRWMSELNSNMRLTRQIRDRSQTLVPVRPSLVGALEFQAVLKSLQKSRNIQTIPLHARRYSDDPTWTTVQQQDNMASTSDPVSRPAFEVTAHEDRTPTLERSFLDLPMTAPVRTRAISAFDADSLKIDPELRRLHDPFKLGQSSQGPLVEASIDNRTPSPAQKQDTGKKQRLDSPSIRISPSMPGLDRASGEALSSLEQSSQRLAPPSIVSGTGTRYSSVYGEPNQRSKKHSLPSPVPRSNNLPKIKIPSRETSYSSKGTTSPFPKFRDDTSPSGSRAPSLVLPSPTMESPEYLSSSLTTDHDASRRSNRLNKWWPHSLLPPPGLIISTLFPTIYHWQEKSIWEKALGIVAAPSVFLLTITLPVVECGEEEADTSIKTYSFDSNKNGDSSGDHFPKATPDDSNSMDVQPGQHRHSSIATNGVAGHGTSATIATHVEQHHRHNFGEAQSANRAAYAQDITKSPQLYPREQPLEIRAPELWNRWLLIVQLFLAPVFIVFAIYTQSPSSLPPTWLIKPILICLLVSSVLLIPLLLTSTATYKPSFYRYILSMVGFMVSIAWISAIAAQVVGALKALAVILNISHAIMGLTIFAVGNSLGDLVADVTVARLGYPVMALSACFGGPMLNILLGIGLSGSYMLLLGAERRVHKHPDKDFKFKVYHIQVSNTLLISGCTLLVTLVGLLIIVPMNRWRFSKRIGWALIIVWILSTIGNVVLEVTGWAERGVED